MSSSLSTAARGDVEIIYDSRPGGAASYLKLGWLLRAACFDAGAHTDLADLADSAIVFGTIMKLIKPPCSSRDTPSRPCIDAATALAKMQWQLTAEPHPRQSPWGNVLSSWRSPTKLDPFFAASPQSLQGVEQGNPRQFAQLADSLRQRAMACGNPHPLFSNAGDFSALGKLRKHGVCFAQHNADDFRPAEVYLFERALVLSAPSSASGFRGADSPAGIEGVVRVNDISGISHSSVTRDGRSCYRVELQSRPLSLITETWALVFDDPSGNISPAWSALLCRLVSQARRVIGSPNIGEPLALGMFTFENWYTPTPTRPVPDIGRLHKYAPVTIHGANCTADCTVYLFDDVLLFIYKDTDGALHIHKRVNLSDVSLLSDRSSPGSYALALTVLGEPDVNLRIFVSGFDYGQPGHTRVDYVFSMRSKDEVKDWLQALEASIFALRPTIPPSDESAPPEPTWHIAGVIFLTMSPGGSANEYNIGVSVLPQFASDQLATHAVSHALKMTFETLRAHRVQARILCTETTAPAMRKFAHLGFTHEGVRRSAAVHPTTGERTDVAILALLDVDWDIRASVQAPTHSLWEEMLERHQRERLLVSYRGPRRTRSMETVRDLRALADAAPAPSILEDAQSTMTSSHTSLSSRITESWYEMPDIEPLDSRMQRPWQTVNADDAADEYSSDSWDDIDE